MTTIKLISIPGKSLTATLYSEEDDSLLVSGVVLTESPAGSGFYGADIDNARGEYKVLVSLGGVGIQNGWITLVEDDVCHMRENRVITVEISELQMTTLLSRIDEQIHASVDNIEIVVESPTQRVILKPQPKTVKTWKNKIR